MEVEKLLTHDALRGRLFRGASVGESARGHGEKEYNHENETGGAPGHE